MEKTYIDVPKKPLISGVRRLSVAFAGTILIPIYWLMAHGYRTPGLRFRFECALLGFRLLFDRKKYILREAICTLLFFPMDSTRYFEFDFMWNGLASVPIGRYLDVSSPRLFPLMLLDKRPEVTAEIINPDREDLFLTEVLVGALELGDRCRLSNCLIESSDFIDESFDVITSISVVEHIPRDTEAIASMWSLLKPGGRLLLSVPCAAVCSEQYISENFYGILEPGTDGYTFWQRFYDEDLLRERIFPVTGKPHRYKVYGEKTPGSFRRNADRKMADPLYPYWREPYMMGKEYRYFESIRDLPGEGVIAMEFVKH